MYSVPGSGTANMPSMPDTPTDGDDSSKDDDDADSPYVDPNDFAVGSRCIWNGVARGDVEAMQKECKAKSTSARCESVQEKCVWIMEHGIHSHINQI